MNDCILTESSYCSPIPRRLHHEMFGQSHVMTARTNERTHDQFIESLTLIISREISLRYLIRGQIPLE